MHKRAGPVVIIALLLACGPLLNEDLARPGGDTLDVADVESARPVHAEVPAAAKELFSGVGDAFVENRGQLEDREVRYYTQGGSVSIGLTDDSIIVLMRGQAQGDDPSGGSAIEGATTHFSIRLDGCERIRPVGRGELARTTSYFHGSDASRWVRSARSFGEVAYVGLWEGVDLVLRLKGDSLKYDLVLAAGADHEAIAFRYEGVQDLSLDFAGDLIIPTDSGALRDGAPVVFQDGVLGAGGARGRFIIRDRHVVGFGLPEGYDAGRPGVIDPGILFSTFLGGTGEDYVESTTLDASGNIVMCGETTSADFPMTDGCYDPAGKANGLKDGFIAVLNSTGWLLASTYIGGSSEEEADDVRVGADGSIIVVGLTTSPDFPVTANATKKSLGGPLDGTLFRLSHDLSDLLYSSYFGGSNADILFHVDLDRDGRAVVSGLTNSSDVATTSDAFCATHEATGGGFDSLLVCVLDGTLGAVEYCTYVNGIDSEHHTAYSTTFYPPALLGQALGADGDVYLTGCTDHRTFPVTPGAFRTEYNGGPMDAFVIRLDPAGNGHSDLVAGTFLGGSGEDSATGICVLRDGRVAVAGHTMSPDIPLVREIDGELGPAGTRDGLMAILDASLSTMDFGTYMGGSGEDMCISLAESNDHGSLYCVGMTSSSNISLLTKGCYDNMIGVPFGRHAYFLAVVNTTDMGLEYGSLFGGSGHIALSWSGHSLIVGEDGPPYINGASYSTDFPTTAGAFQERFGGGGSDAFLLRFDPTPCDLPGPPRDIHARAGDRMVTLEWAAHTNIGYRVMKHRVYWGTANGTWDHNETLDGTALGSEFPGMTNGVRYYFGVATVNTMGEGPIGIVSAVPQVPPSAPRSLTLTTGDGNVSISWTSPSSTGGALSGYCLLRGVAPADLGLLHRCDATARSYLDWNVTKGQRYFYAVFAFNDAGNGTRAFADITPWTPPSPPTSFGLVPNDRSINVSWGPPVDSGGLPISGYRVYIRDGRTNETRVVELAGATALAYEDHRVQNGQRYHYRITALAGEPGEPESRPTMELSEVPFGTPEAPLNLTAHPQDLQVRLEWTAPFDNGRPITHYVIRWGIAPSELVNVLEIGDTTAHTQPVGLNGVKYYFQVVAKNEAGEGAGGEEVWAIPLGVPGGVQGLTAAAGDGGVRLAWDAPSDTGGAVQLVYHMERIDPDGRMVVLDDVVDVGTYLDTTVELGSTYTYRVIASNALATGPPEEVEVEFVLPPSAVTGLAASAGDGRIELRWEPPESDGGTGITAYFIYRRGPAGDFARINWTLMLNYTDGDVVVGTEYSYYVTARNDRNESVQWAVVSGRAITHPGPVVGLQATYREGGVELQWLAPSAPWGAVPTGYAVLRGTNTTERTVVAEVGLNLSYRDEAVEGGVTYYYWVIARSAIGDGDTGDAVAVPPPSAPAVSYVWLAALVAIVIAVLLAMVIVYRRRARAAAGAPTVHIVEEVLVVLRDGRLIADSARDEARGRDAEVMTGMLTAIQGFAKDGLERGGALESIKYEENSILMVSGTRLYVAAVVYGLPDDALRDVMEETVRQLEATYGEIIDGWDGDLSVFAGVSEAVQPLVERTRHVTREDVQAAGAAPDETDAQS